jgi:ribosome-associated toxin RatA of RatAB toxin-antitoxin module
MLLLSGAAAAQGARGERGDIRIESALQSTGRGGTVVAELVIRAPADTVFAAMSRCTDALKYLPHLRHCREWPGDEGSLLVEHEVDFGWYAPRIRYVFRAELDPGRRISFRQVQGDFTVNEGVWELEPTEGGTRVRYRARVEAPSYIPGWLARAALTREFPRMLSELRRLCEDRQRLTAQANIFLTTPSLD